MVVPQQISEHEDMALKKSLIFLMRKVDGKEPTISVTRSIIAMASVIGVRS